MDNTTNNNLTNDGIQNNMPPVTPSIPLKQQETIKFDPMTGESLTTTPIEVNTETQHQNANVNNAVQIQNELQNIPTVEQGEEVFINNVQSMNQEKKEEKKEGVNFLFIIILFVVILAAIFFLFPLLLDYI